MVAAQLLFGRAHAREVQPGTTSQVLAPEPGAQRLDGLAAVVGGLAPGPQVIAILQSDVERRARLALLRETDVRTALGPLPPALLAASLKELLGEALIAVESARLNMVEPSGAALAAQRAQLLGTSQRPSAARTLLEALGVNDRELAEWIERRAVVDAFLQANLEGTLEVSDAELERLFAAEAHPFRDQTFESASADFARWLSRHRLQQAVARWVTSLSQRIPHRVLVSF
jgi:hypothetical protein